MVLSVNCVRVFFLIVFLQSCKAYATLVYKNIHQSGAKSREKLGVEGGASHKLTDARRGFSERTDGIWPCGVGGARESF